MDGVHFNIRLEEDRLAALVVISAPPDETKEVVAIEDGYRESTESRLAVLRDLKIRGMRPPALVIRDGALGFWAAVREVLPEAREQRCWMHRIANVLDKFPTRLQHQAKLALHETMYALSREVCETAMQRFAQDHAAKYPKAAKALCADVPRFLTTLIFQRPTGSCREGWQLLSKKSRQDRNLSNAHNKERIVNTCLKAIACLIATSGAFTGCLWQVQPTPGERFCPLDTTDVMLVVSGQPAHDGSQSGRSSVETPRWF